MADDPNVQVIYSSRSRAQIKSTLVTAFTLNSTATRSGSIPTMASRA